MEPRGVALGHSRSCEGEHRDCSAMKITLERPPVQAWLTEAKMYTQKIEAPFLPGYTVLQWSIIRKEHDCIQIKAGY